MERSTIIVSGIVQGVGFRYKVRAEARLLGIMGYVKNLADGSVEIVAEGTRSNIESFIQKIRDTEKPVEVDYIQVSYQKATDEFVQFGIKTGDMLTEMVEGFGTNHMLFGAFEQK